MRGEFDLIEGVFANLTPAGATVLRGIGDDCALLSVPSGQALAVTTDTLVDGVHYPCATAPADVGWKALACSLSDLAAKGAEPAWATLALGLPQLDTDWVERFAHGFAELAAQHGVSLVGGDLVQTSTTTITVQLGGHVPPDAFIPRGGAAPGDPIFVSGWPGEAAAALARGPEHVDPALRARLDRPEPRVALGYCLRGWASASIDVSDGLVADLGHILRASGVGACLDAQRLPISPRLRAIGDTDTSRRWMLYGGDDYELCFCLSGNLSREISNLDHLPHPITQIGAVEEEPGIRLRGEAGDVYELAPHGYQHFNGDHDGSSQ